MLAILFVKSLPNEKFIDLSKLKELECIFSLLRTFSAFPKVFPSLSITRDYQYRDMQCAFR